MPAEPAVLQLPRWLALWSRLGAQSDGLQVFQTLSATYTQAARVYHTTEHISDCLSQFDWSRELAERPDEVEAALWFHDAVYAPGATDNEEQSARLAQALLESGGVPRESVQRIAELVLATRHLSIPQDPDTRHLCDIDLSILGRERPEFERFERKIRQEFSWVPAPVYRSTRSRVLRGFLDRPAIYQTRMFRDRYELRARQNLEWALAVLSS
jgi:predicted metal-dependent HD superfamily phosphohydrolase